MKQRPSKIASSIISHLTLQELLQGGAKGTNKYLIKRKRRTLEKRQAYWEAVKE